MIAVAIVIEALSPSTLWVPGNCTCKSKSLMSLPVSFFTTALMFVTLSLAKSESPPVAMTCPDLPCVGVTMASTGRTTPE